MQPITKKIIASALGSSVGCYIHYQNNLKQNVKLNKKTSIFPTAIGFMAGMTNIAFIKTDKPLINLFMSGVLSGFTSKIMDSLLKSNDTNKVAEQDNLYNFLHENIKSKLSEYLSDASIENIKGIYENSSSENADLNKTISEINDKYGDNFKNYQINNQKNPLSSYVVALDKCHDSRTYDSIFIHAAATLKAYRDDESSPKLQGLTEAKEIMMAAIAVSRVHSDFENIMKPPIANKYRNSDGNIDAGNNGDIDEELKKTLPEYMKYYQAVIDHYGSAPFLVRTGKKPRSDSNLNVLDEARDSFTHFGSVIVEKPDYQKNEYQIRFVDPSSNEDVVYKIQNGKLNDVLLRLHNVYSNGNPSNNLGGSGIRASMFDSGTLSKNSIKIPRQSQSGLQCGIHSSRRIIPASVYKKLGVDDCDIAKLVNI